MRALETARPIIRATNTGMTAVISARGIVQIRLRPHETGTLKATLQGHTGLTPYVRLGGNAPLREGPDTKEGDTHDSRSAGKHHW